MVKICKEIFVAIFLTLVCFFQSTAHPFYVSIIQIDHNTEQNSLEVTFKIFTDDLEMAVFSEDSVKLGLSTSKQNKNANQILSEFIQRHFALSIENKQSDNTFIGFESEFDVTRIYFEYTGVPDKVEELKVNSNLLTAQFPDQSNILHYEKKGSIKSLILNASNNSGIIKPDF